jgi:hypothetical protein
VISGYTDTLFRSEDTPGPSSSSGNSYKNTERTENARAVYGNIRNTPVPSTSSGNSYGNTERTETARAAYGNIGNAPGGPGHSYNNDKGSGYSKGVLGNMDGDSFEQFMRQSAEGNDVRDAGQSSRT